MDAAQAGNQGLRRPQAVDATPLRGTFVSHMMFYSRYLPPAMLSSRCLPTSRSSCRWCWRIFSGVRRGAAAAAARRPAAPWQRGLSTPPLPWLPASAALTPRCRQRPRASTATTAAALRWSPCCRAGASPPPGWATAVRCWCDRCVTLPPALHGHLEGLGGNAAWLGDGRGRHCCLLHP